MTCTAAQETLPTAELLGLNFCDAATTAVARWLAARASDAPFGYVVTPNADHLVRISRERSLLPVYRNALLCLMDSTVVMRTAHLLGWQTASVVRGSDLAALLLKQHMAVGERLTVIGMQSHVVERLREACPNLTIAHHNPPMGFDRDPVALTAAIRFAITHPARLTVLAVGMPRQERLAAAIAETGEAFGVGLCVGSALEFIAGTHPRAPRWLQQAGLEWLFRMLREPRRLGRRYLVQCPPVFRLLWQQRPMSRPSLRQPGRDPSAGRERTRSPPVANTMS